MKKRIKDGVENKPVWHGMLALYYSNMRDSELAEGAIENLPISQSARHVMENQINFVHLKVYEE